MGTTTKQKLAFIKVLIALVLIWIIIAFWTKFVGDLVYVTLGLNQNSTFTSFCIASIITLIMICYIFALDDHDDDSGKCIQNHITGNILTPVI